MNTMVSYKAPNFTSFEPLSNNSIEYKFTYKIAMAADVINRGAGSVSVGLVDRDQNYVASALGSVKSQQVVPDLEIPVGFTVSTKILKVALQVTFNLGNFLGHFHLV